MKDMSCERGCRFEVGLYWMSLFIPTQWLRITLQSRIPKINRKMPFSTEKIQCTSVISVELTVFSYSSQRTTPLLRGCFLSYSCRVFLCVSLTPCYRTFTMKWGVLCVRCPLPWLRMCLCVCISVSWGRVGVGLFSIFRCDRVVSRLSVSVTSITIFV